MRLIVKAPFQEDETLMFRNDAGAPLSEYLSQCKDGIRMVIINGKTFPEWGLYVPENDDRIEVYTEASGPFAPMIIMMVIQILLSVIMQLLQPKPKKPRKPQESFGVAGISNTVAPGTPKFFVAGTRRVFGHIIASKVSLSKLVKKKKNMAGLYRKMNFEVMYFMSAGQIQDIRGVKINNTNIADVKDAYYDKRLGTDDQLIYPGHELVYQTYGDSRTIAYPTKDDPDANEEIVYTTKGKTDAAAAFLNFPSGLFTTDELGEIKGGYCVIQVWTKKNSETQWTEYADSPYTIRAGDGTQDGCFYRMDFNFSDYARYDIKFQTKEVKHKIQSSAPMLLNVMEIIHIQTAYPGNATLLIGGVGSEKITGLEQLETSAIVDGRLWNAWDDDCQMFIKKFTRQRVWIAKGVLEDPDHGLGNALNRQIFDDAAGVIAQRYYDEMVNGSPIGAASEVRDYCDMIFSDKKPGWDYLKTITFEGDGRLIPRNGLLKYIVDKGGSPRRRFTHPGNIIDGTLSVEYGRNDRPVNTITGEFADCTDEYKAKPGKLTVVDAGFESTMGPERVEDGAYDTIVRPSQFARKMYRDLAALYLTDKFWNWNSPKTIGPCEPFDVLGLNYETANHLRGVSGFAAGACTTTVVNLDRMVTLAAGTNVCYIIHIKTGITEQRNISTGAGTWGKVTLSSALAKAPSEGDIFVIDKSSPTSPNVVVTDISRNETGQYTVRASKYISEVYTIPGTLPDPLSLVSGQSATALVMPIIIPQVFEYFASSHWRWDLKVAPGFSGLENQGRVASDGTVITLSTDEPAIDDYFNGARISISDNSRYITDYDGTTRIATLDRPVRSTGYRLYRITWDSPATFGGFKVEKSANQTGPWTQISNVDTWATNVLANPDASGYTGWFKFTPHSTGGTDNPTGAWVVQLGTEDATDPDPPTKTEVSSNLKVVVADVTLAMPLSRDTHQLYVEFRHNDSSGTLYQTVTQDLSASRDEGNQDDTAFTVTADLSAQAYGTIIFVRARVDDYFGNSSAWTDGDKTTELSETAPEEGSTSAPSTGTPATTITNTTTETTIFTKDVTGGTLSTDGGFSVLCSLLMTDSDAANNATITFKVKYGGTLANTLVVRTSDTITNIGTTVPWWLELVFAAKGSTGSQLSILRQTGLSVLTNNGTSPYPGRNINMNTASISVDSQATKTLQITAQWSSAHTGLTLLEEWYMVRPVQASIFAGS